MRLETIHLIALQNVVDKTWVDIRKISEPHRQRLIDLGMMEPPLVDIDADQIYITEAGRNALAINET